MKELDLEVDADISRYRCRLCGETYPISQYPWSAHIMLGDIGAWHQKTKGCDHGYSYLQGLPDQDAQPQGLTFCTCPLPCDAHEDSENQNSNDERGV